MFLLEKRNEIPELWGVRENESHLFQKSGVFWEFSEMRRTPHFSREPCGVGGCGMWDVGCGEEFLNYFFFLISN
jgi:hypothetical protein